MPSSPKFEIPLSGRHHDPQTQALERTAQQHETKPSPMRDHFVAATSEFVGTFLFLFHAFLTHQMCADHPAGLARNDGPTSETVVLISMAYGFSLLVAAWTFYRISGGQFNPAVTLALLLSGNLPWARGLICIPVQLLGGICAAAVVSAIVPGDIASVRTGLAPGVSSAQGVFIEMFLTAMVTFTILMLAAEKGKQTFIAPLGIGLALFVGNFAGVGYTGASLNPARSFGPCVAASSFQHYHWIYWIGPCLGAAVSAGYYHFIKFLHYEHANPGQDSADGGFHPVKDMQKPTPFIRDESATTTRSESV